AYWQGERLTAIEGRLYKEILERGGRVNEEKLTLNARKELAKNRAVPDAVLTFGKASSLTEEEQIKQFEQHVLIHQDRTNQPPNPSDLEKICQVVKDHGQPTNHEKIEDKARSSQPSTY